MPPPKTDAKPRVHVDAPHDKLERLRQLQKLAAQRERALVVEDRRALLEQCPHPLALAQHLDDQVIATPAMELVSKALVETLRTWNGRRTLSLPPQNGKSSLSRWFVFFALLDNPDRRVVFASYSMGLARTSGRIIRSMIAQYGQPYGLELDQSHHDAADWQLAGYAGGVLSASIESTLTGRPSDCFVGSTRVETSEGPVPIGELHQRSARPLVASWDETGRRIRWNRIVATRRLGQRPLVDVLTHGGRRLRCTPDHPLYVLGRGWVAAGELRRGDRLQVADALPGLPDHLRPTAKHRELQSQRSGLLFASLPGPNALAASDDDVHPLRGRVHARRREGAGVGRSSSDLLLPCMSPRVDHGDAGAEPVWRLREGHGPQEDRGALPALLLGSMPPCPDQRHRHPDERASTSGHGHQAVCPLRGSGDPSQVRARQGGAARATRVLLEKVFLRPVGLRGHEVQGVQHADTARQGRAVLLGRVPDAGVEGRQASGPRVPAEFARHHLPDVRGDVQAEEQQVHVLLSSVRGLKPLRSDGWEGELALHGRHQLRGVVQADAAASDGTGRVLSSLRPHPGAASVHPQRETRSTVQVDRAPHRRGPAEQHPAELDHPVSGLSHDAPQVDGDAVAMVRRVRGPGEPVYDLQVDRDHNFFAEEVLAHNCMIMDDLLADESQANSPTIREKVETWWESTARTRMAPGTAAIAIGTRWSELDILGRFIAEGWDRINIPAVADGETFDSVEGIEGARTDDGYLISTRGTTPEDWRKVKHEMGSRAFAALMQGRPAPLEGGIYQRSWITLFRQWQAPTDLDMVAVFIDPAESGKGDAAGILVAGRTRSGRIPFLADYSGQYTAGQWGRKACLAWMDWDAARIVQERNLGMRTVLPDSWTILYRQASALADADNADTGPNSEEERVRYALRALFAVGDNAAADEDQLLELVDTDTVPAADAEREAPRWQRILDRGPTGPRVVQVTPRFAKRIRAESAAAAWETGRAYMVGHLVELEQEMVGWVEGAPSPNRLDTMSMATAHLDQAGGRTTVTRRPRHLQAVPTTTVHTLAR